jgi:hypothetical protein
MILRSTAIVETMEEVEEKTRQEVQEGAEKQPQGRDEHHDRKSHWKNTICFTMENHALDADSLDTDAETVLMRVCQQE